MPLCFALSPGCRSSIGISMVKTNLDDIVNKSLDSGKKRDYLNVVVIYRRDNHL